MEDQRFWIAKVAPGVFKWAIDPTCARYALKSLLKYLEEKKEGKGRVTSITVGYKRGEFPTWSKSTSTLGYLGDAVQYCVSNWAGYDAYDNFPEAESRLVQARKPNTLSGWQRILEASGPIILGGQPIGAAVSVGHAILLVGVDTEKKQFLYLDALVGDKVQTADFLPMQDNIWTQIVHAK